MNRQATEAILSLHIAFSAFLFENLKPHQEFEMLAATFANYNFYQSTHLLVRTGPTIVVLWIGLWICFRNRFRRPRIARLIGGAIVAELILLGFQSGFAQLVSWTLSQLGQAKAFSNPDEMTRWASFFGILSLVIYNFLYAGIWGTALAAALYVDKQESEKIT